MGTMAALQFLAAWLGLAFAGTIATVWWSGRVWKRRDALPVRVKVVAGMVAAAALLGGLGTVVGLIKAFGATGGESVDPSQRARILAEGISEAMNWTALGIAVWLPCVIVLMIVTRKRKET